jgi:GWxTD domain-containing protein
VKKFIFLSIWIFFQIADVKGINVFVDANRFLDENGHTLLEINYQIPYNSLKFETGDYGWSAELDVQLYLIRNDQIVHEQSFTNNIILKDEQRTNSPDFFSDKISLTLALHEFEVVLNFLEISTSQVQSWNYFFRPLDVDVILSDLELSSEVEADSSQYMAKFHRMGKLFHISADHIISRLFNDQMFLYFQIYNHDLLPKTFQTELQLFRKDRLVFAEIKAINSDNFSTEVIYPVSLVDLEEGLYDVLIIVTDPVANNVETSTTYFSLKLPGTKGIRIFPTLEDDYKLISYFLSPERAKSWHNLTDSGKKTFIDRFWAANDPNPITEENEFYKIVLSRIELANRDFGHFDAGWTTDRGRILIRHGEPDEVVKGDTGLRTKYTQKEYLIWKYRLNKNLTYIFIDLQMNGNYKLIYADDDPDESTNPNWLEYLGTDFDYSTME